jgi:hypothetical protein
MFRARAAANRIGASRWMRACSVAGLQRLPLRIGRLEDERRAVAADGRQRPQALFAFDDQHARGVRDLC